MTLAAPFRPAARHWQALALIVVIGAALRIALAQGGLWLDEAWSAVHAHEAGTPLGIFLGINHDNNHHLNSLWMQAVGIDAPPLLQRALAILCGTAAIAVAALLAASRGAAAMLVTGWTFAVSPMLATLGSEARGYAPMLLALLAATLFVDRWLAGDPGYRRPTMLALLFALGTLAQLTMLFAICALVGWAASVLLRRDGLRPAVIETLRVFGPALLATAAVVAAIFGTAAASDQGFRFGSYTPFDAVDLLHALAEMLGFAFAYRWIDLWPIVIALAALVLATRPLGDRAAFFWLAIVGFPLGLVLLQVGNVGYPRYFLLVAVALLLLAAGLVAHGLAAAGARRWAALALLAAFSVASLVDARRQISEQRGDPDRAVAAMASLAPAGATLAIDRGIGTAMLSASALRLGYTLRIVPATCATAPDFVFLDRYRGEPRQAALPRCGHRYRAIAHAEPTGLSGTHWTLYRRAR